MTKVFSSLCVHLFRINSPSCTDTSKGDDSCYPANALGNGFGNCGYNQTDFIPCAKR